MKHLLESHRGLLVGCALVAATILQPGDVRAAQYDVGTGSGCEAGTLAAALLGAAFSAEDDVIRLSRTVSYGNIAQELTNWDSAGSGALTIIGGWDSCTDATPSGRTLVDGNGSDPVFEIIAHGGRQSNVTLANLEIVGGGRGVMAHGMGTANVDLDNVYIRNNSGSGVRATTGAQVHIDLNSSIASNGSGTTFGGGIHCSDPGTDVFLAGVVYDNEASSSGGGVYAEASCQVHLQDGALIHFNQAAFGGGFYVQSGAEVDGGGTGPYGVIVRNNTATTQGGGFWVNGTDSSVFLANTKVEDNSAGSVGGGVSVTNNGSFHLERFNWEQCADPPRCATISDNTLTAGFDGSAVHVSTGGQFTMYQGFIEGNSGQDEAGFVLLAEDSGSDMLLEGVQLWDNRTVSMLAAEDGATILAAFVTAAGNDYLVSGGPNRFNSRGGQASGGAAIHLRSSILVDQRPFVANTGTITGDCLLLDTADGLSSFGGTDLTGADPMFLGPDSGNLRLSLTSPAVDACDATQYSPIDADYDVDPRGWDNPSKPNSFGPYDLGADEASPLFMDGFESGNTSAWSGSVP